ncbi:hypothetical protein GIX45_26125 [Erwinia sp. CPCC 100877]|nr:hypothetical protein [Erwinia sp. CPCC 100877]
MTLGLFLFALKRVKAFIKIDDKILPQVTFSRITGNTNCLCSFSKTNVTIDQTGKFKFLANLPIEKQIASFPLSDIITKDQSYFLGADSLKVAHWILHADLFAEINIPISASFPEILALKDEEEAAEKNL